MRKRTKLLIAAAACLAAALAAFAAFALLTRDHEPEYQGRPLSYWISLYDPSFPEAADRQMADTAVCQIGTNAIPHLLKWMAYDGRARYRREQTMRRYLPSPIHRKYLLDILCGDAANEERAICACVALRALGSQGRPAIPELTRMLHNTDSDAAASLAASALARTGPDALPALLAVATNVNMPPYLRREIILRIPDLGTNAHLAVPALNQLLADVDPDAKVQGTARYALAQIALLGYTNAPPP